MNTRDKRKYLLTEHESNHQVWTKVENYLKERLEALRLKNDSLNLSEQETIAIRAEIKVVKDLLALAPDQARKPFVVNIQGGDEIPPKQEDSL